MTTRRPLRPTITTEPWYGHEWSLRCPVCLGDFTHLDNVSMAARPDGEDGRIVNVSVGATGNVSHPLTLPVADYGRRHAVVIEGSCEEGHQFAFVFRQHKGETLVSVMDLTPPVDLAAEARKLFADVTSPSTT